MCSVTDGSGTASELITGKHWGAGTYRLQFETGAYFHNRLMETIYPHIDVSIISAFWLFKVYMYATIVSQVLFWSNSGKNMAC